MSSNTFKPIKTKLEKIDPIFGVHVDYLKNSRFVMESTKVLS